MQEGESAISFSVRMHDGVNLRARKRRRIGGLIVLVHGRLHRKAAGPMCAIEPILNQGYDTMAFDARGMGESGGETGYSNVEDLHSVLRHLVDERHEFIIALAGHSKGAVVILQYLSMPRLRNHDPLAVHLFISISARYDARDASGIGRFTDAQRAELEEKGSFTWLNYRVGPESDRSERRPYIVTREAVEAHSRRNLDCLSDAADGSQVLLLHGSADGTVASDQALTINARLKQSGATSDLILLDGVKHNWDSPGEPTLLHALIVAWLEQRLSHPAIKYRGQLVDHLGQDRDRTNGAVTSVT